MDGGSKGLSLQLGDREIEVLAIRFGTKVYCYLNRCPHTGVNLDWVADQFLDNSGEYVQCATHGALFRIDDGFCVSGPCAGQALTALKVRVEGEYFEILSP